MFLRLKPWMIVVSSAVVLGLGIGLLMWFRGGLADFRHQRTVARGAQLAAVYCSVCHLEPDPEILPARSWEAALGYMGFWLGMESLDYLADHPEFARENVAARLDVLLRENVFPERPLLSETDWESIRAYYLGEAHDEPLPQSPKPQTTWELSQFDIRDSDYAPQGAVTTLVRIREDLGEVYVGDSRENSLAVLGSNGQLKYGPRRFGPAMSPVDVAFAEGLAYLGSIGDLLAMQPSDTKPARIATLSLPNQSIEGGAISVLIDEIYRMADFEAIDLNHDGVTDFVVSGFGAVRGSVSWFESQPEGGYIERLLIDRPGAVKTASHDFDGDGFLDLAVLLSDAREGFYILVNDGANQFDVHPVFETHAAYGHTYFELVDFNADGMMDVLVVNGDNVDSDPYNTLKNYHGLRIYLNRGNMSFELASFYPMYGAFGARAEDFDDDGDVDIAAISFYPDFSSARRESFVYLENVGDLQFEAFSDIALTSGRWLTIDGGDIDGDGDKDIVLGGGYFPTGMFAHMDLFEELAATGPAVLVLENTLY